MKSARLHGVKVSSYPDLCIWEVESGPAGEGASEEGPEIERAVSSVGVDEESWCAVQVVDDTDRDTGGFDVGGFALSAAGFMVL